MSTPFVKTTAYPLNGQALAANAAYPLDRSVSHPNPREGMAILRDGGSLTDSESIVIPE